MEIHVSGICERDLDLLLLEEFVSSVDFAQWFLTEIAGQGFKVEGVVSAARSVTQSNGESDLEILMNLSTGDRFLLLIENKVDAAFQKDQAARYQARKRNYLEISRAENCRTALVAPAAYLAGGSSNVFDAKLSYEDIRDWMTSRGDRSRMGYKATILESAIEKSAKGYDPEEDQPVTDFWQSYWELCSVEAPALAMDRPAGKPAGAGFIHFRPTTFPQSLHIVHKLKDGYVDLQISGGASQLHLLASRVKPALEEGMAVAKASKSAAVRIEVPILNTADGFVPQREKILVGLSAAKRLLEWGEVNHQLLTGEGE